MPARNLKCIIMGRNRTGIDHEMKKEHPPLGTVFSLLNQWLCLTTISLRNILWAQRHIQTLREHTDWLKNIQAQEPRKSAWPVVKKSERASRQLPNRKWIAGSSRQ
jgi:hypothetical protein